MRRVFSSAASSGRAPSTDLKGFESIDRVPGDVLQPDVLTASVEGCTALVHLVGIIREQRGRGVTFERLHTQATRNMLALARAAGVKRFTQMSALGARPGARAALSPDEVGTRRKPCGRATSSWTIFRPSIIFGRGDAFMSVLGRTVNPAARDAGARRRPLPAPADPGGAGRGGLRPRTAHARAAFVRRTRWPARRRTPFVDLLDEIGRALGRARVRKLRVPLAPVRLMTRALDWLPSTRSPPTSSSCSKKRA